jgi:hypothetical protein
VNASGIRNSERERRLGQTKIGFGRLRMNFESRRRRSHSAAAVV